MEIVGYRRRIAKRLTGFRFPGVGFAQHGIGRHAAGIQHGALKFTPLRQLRFRHFVTYCRHFSYYPALVIWYLRTLNS
jgi:hypothetical protein